MSATFLPFILCFWWCSLLLCASVAQGSHSTIIVLEANGSVKNGSMAYYDATTAQLALQLQMLMHYKSQQQQIKYRFQLSLVKGSKETMNDRQFSKCSAAFSKYAGSCKERHFYRNISHDHNNLSVQFEHVYSGCYKLNINCCSNKRIFCDEVRCAPNSWMYEQYLGYLETSLQDVNVSLMNMSIRLKPIVGGAEVEFVVNYMENLRRILQFKEFDVTIKDEGNYSATKSIIDSNVVNFMNCTETNASHTSHQNPDRCVRLPIGNYSVVIEVDDSRCNYPIQNCETIRRPCKRFSATPTLLDFTNNNDSFSIILKPDITFIWMTLLGLLIVLMVVAVVYVKRDWDSNRQLCATLKSNDDEESTHFESTPLSSIALNVRVLLVYDTNDESIQIRAQSLRQQLTASGVSTVYDAGDPDQQEDIIIRGEIHWFNGYVHDPQVKIIVIQSIGMNQCHEELNRDPNTAECSIVQDLDKLSGLMFMLSTLFYLAVSISQSELYGRIFVATYDDVQCNRFHNPLTPYRCYVLPEHYNMLITGLLVDRSEEN